MVGKFWITCKIVDWTPKSVYTVCVETKVKLIKLTNHKNQSVMYFNIKKTLAR